MRRKKKRISTPSLLKQNQIIIYCLLFFTPFLIDFLPLYLLNFISLFFEEVELIHSWCCLYSIKTNILFRKTQNFFCLKKLFMFMPSEKEWGEREKMYNNEHTHFIIHTCQFLLGKLKNCTKENYVFCTHIWTFLPLICLFNARLKIMRIFFSDFGIYCEYTIYYHSGKFAIFLYANYLIAKISIFYIHMWFFWVCMRVSIN